MDLGLASKVVLVTAASRGLGRAIAEGFAREGATVVASARSAGEIRTVAEELARDTDSEVIAIAADGTRAEDVERLVDEAEQRLGPIDILVNNSPGPTSESFAAMTDDAWCTGLDVKLMAQIRYARAVFPRMVHRGGGRIVSTSEHTACSRTPTL